MTQGGCPDGYHIEIMLDGQEACVDDSGNAITPDPFDPGFNNPNPQPLDPKNVMPSQGGSTTVTSGGTAPFNTDVLKWLGALVLLWIILTALTEYSPNTAPFGQAFAGLILFGALYYMGPQAIANVKNVWGKSS